VVNSGKKKRGLKEIRREGVKGIKGKVAENRILSKGERVRKKHSENLRSKGCRESSQKSKTTLGRRWKDRRQKYGGGRWQGAKDTPKRKLRRAQLLSERGGIKGNKEANKVAIVTKGGEKGADSENTVRLTLLRGGRKKSRRVRDTERPAETLPRGAN